MERDSFHVKMPTTAQGWGVMVPERSYRRMLACVALVERLADESLAHCPDDAEHRLSGLIASARVAMRFYDLPQRIPLSDNKPPLWRPVLVYLSDGAVWVAQLMGKHWQFIHLVARGTNYDARMGVPEDEPVSWGEILY